MIFMQDVTRRSFLAASVVATGAALRAQSTVTQKFPGYIDAHVHVWSPDVARWPTAAGMSKAGIGPDSFTPEELFAHCKPCGVDRVVLIQMSFYKYDNAYMLDAMRRFPGSFAGVAIVDHTQPDVVERMKSLAAEGCRGFRLTGWKDPEQYFAAPGIETMWRYGAEANLNMGLLINAAALPRIDRMCEQFPDTPVVIDHFARVGIDGEFHDADVKNLCRLARHKRTYVKTSAFYALGKKQTPYTDLLPLLKSVYEAFGPDRLMWASDGPFQVVGGHNYRDSIDLVLQRADFLSETDRRKLLRDTAERVYFS
jgi:predicted TIM-barrel fold metal-dependent hydrolase